MAGAGTRDRALARSGQIMSSSSIDSRSCGTREKSYSNQGSRLRPGLAGLAVWGGWAWTSLTAGVH